MPELLSGDDIDKRLNWPLGRAERLAKRGKLPHFVLPDDSVRFGWDDLSTLIVHVLPDGTKPRGQNNQHHNPKTAAGRRASKPAAENSSP